MPQTTCARARVSIMKYTPRLLSTRSPKSAASNRLARIAMGNASQTVFAAVRDKSPTA
jgi:hypothetical protein